MAVHEVKVQKSGRTLSPKELEKQFATIEAAAGEAPPDFRENFQWAEEQKKKMKIVN